MQAKEAKPRGMRLSSPVKAMFLLALGFFLGTAFQILWYIPLRRVRGALGVKAAHGFGLERRNEITVTANSGFRSEAQIRFREKCCTGSHASIGYWDARTGKWVRSNPMSGNVTMLCQAEQQAQHTKQPGCLTLRREREEDANYVFSCLAKLRRIVLVGDSVQRGLFWSLVDMIEEAKVAVKSNLSISIHKNYDAKGHFTNFQDQDMIVSETNSGRELFSIRFIYGSNAFDWEGRCATIRKWFFQCLRSTSEILARVVEEEHQRDLLHRNIQTKSANSDNHIFRGSEKRQNHDLRAPVGILYWNTGLWDWRTGRSVEEFTSDMQKLLTSGKSDGGAFSTGFAEKVVWRSTSASWPSKFMDGIECKSKPHGGDDPRPCSIHTDTIMRYNTVAREMIMDAGMIEVDSWPITNGRPDLSFDGLHFEHRNNDAFTTPEEVKQVYRLLNDIFLNTVCYI